MQHLEVSGAVRHIYVIRLLKLKMIYISDISCTENQNTHFVFSNIFCSKNPTVNEKMKNFVEPVRPHMTIWRMRIACWRPKATNAHSEYVILIALALQQWLY